MSQWVRIISWHLQSTTSRNGAGIITLCGRWAPRGSQEADDRPQGKTCETCLRIKVGR